jgi:hypothetical protein
MKITIEPETDDERKALAKPWVRTGCIRFGLSGIADRTEENKTGEFGFLHGDGIGIRGDLARIIASLDAQTMVQTSVNGALQAQRIIGNAQAEARVTQELLANRNGMRIHRE